MTKSFDELVEPKTRAAAAGTTRKYLAEMLLAEVRKLTGKSPREIAELLGVRPPAASSLESYDDLHVSSLLKIVEDLGGELEIVLRFPNGEAKIEEFGISHRGKRKLTELQGT